MESLTPSPLPPIQPVTRPASSRVLTIALASIFGLIVVLGIFQLGLLVGFNKSRSACKWGERYGAALDMPHFPRGSVAMPGPLDASAVAGDVLAIHERELVVKGGDGTEKIVLIRPQTELRKGRGTIKLDGLHAMDKVVVFGEASEQGQINAYLIRVFDQPLLP